jgi:hypothetical protein
VSGTRSSNSDDCKRVSHVNLISKQLTLLDNLAADATPLSGTFFRAAGVSLDAS